MLMRFDPFRDVDRMTRRVWETATPQMGAMDAYRTEHAVVVEFDLPGVDPDSIELTVEKDTLQVAARRVRGDREGDTMIVAERPHGEFTRQVFLGTGLDADRIEASYDAGVLTVKIPVAEEAKPRRITINNGTRKQAVEAQAS